MAQETEFAIGTRVSCPDGDCGVLRRIIIHPDARMVTHLVIEPRHGHQPGRLVPVDLVDAADGEIRLRCTIAEFEHLDPADDEELVEGAGLGISGMPGGPPAGIPGPVQVVVEDVVPVGEEEVCPGDPVHATDGEIGAVQGFLVNPGDNQVTHLLLKEGHLWGRKKVAIPISAVTGVEEGIINVNLTKKQVEDLPPAG
jgi:sporulation protein YlmC with PRC-barrel domain